MNEFWHKVRRAVSVLLAVALVVTTTPLARLQTTAWSQQRRRPFPSAPLLTRKRPLRH